jgi:4-hydroxybenzoate polyprenyltransferase
VSRDPATAPSRSCGVLRGWGTLIILRATRNVSNHAGVLDKISLVGDLFNFPNWILQRIVAWQFFTTVFSRIIDRVTSRHVTSKYDVNWFARHAGLHVKVMLAQCFVTSGVSTLSCSQFNCSGQFSARCHLKYYYEYICSLLLLICSWVIVSTRKPNYTPLYSWMWAL